MLDRGQCAEHGQADVEQVGQFAAGRFLAPLDGEIERGGGGEEHLGEAAIAGAGLFAIFVALVLLSKADKDAE